MPRRAGDEGDTSTGSVHRRVQALEGLFERVRSLEELAIKDDGLHHSLLVADSQTASAVERLTEAVNDPHKGLIVELNNFRAEVRADRAAFKAWVRGAVVVLSVVYAIVTFLAPYIQQMLGLK